MLGRKRRLKKLLRVEDEVADNERRVFLQDEHLIERVRVRLSLEDLSADLVDDDSELVLKATGCE